MYCFHCNGIIRIVEDGWICFHCGENGPNCTPTKDIGEAVIYHQPLERPHIRLDKLK